jgi:endonuclease YncB( thermonuclease family)
MISRSFAILLLVFLVFPTPVFAEQGKILEVVDGDTFKAEVEGKRGPESIEIHLRCSDAPVISSAFGQESRKFLQQLLAQGSTIQYKVQAYCGSEKCVEALAYFPPPEDQSISYINTEMIAAGMARNNGCRGQFAEAEESAKAAKAGIWSTTAKIAYSETRKSVTVKPAATATTTKKTTTTSQQAPAIIRYDRVERTVTIKSRKISLSRVIETIDTVSPSPIKLYLQEQQYIPINVENAHWYDALSYVLETADLKQVNLDGKIDLYSRLFYYKHVSPYLKVAGNVGVYMNTGSAPKGEPLPDRFLS